MPDPLESLPYEPFSVPSPSFRTVYDCDQRPNRPSKSPQPTRNMEVQLYVYDLSNGIARNLSFALLGIQIDAVYHTSIVMNGLEYVYDGGLKTVAAGKTHLGSPLQVVDLGTTNLPMDIIMEYLDSLKEIFTAEVRIISAVERRT